MVNQTKKPTTTTTKSPDHSEPRLRRPYTRREIQAGAIRPIVMRDGIRVLRELSVLIDDCLPLEGRQFKVSRVTLEHGFESDTRGNLVYELIPTGRRVKKLRPTRTPTQ